MELIRAEFRYRFIAILEQNADTLPVLFADEEAARFLPTLPPLDPNDNRKIQQSIREASLRVSDILLGAKQDGERVRPLIDFTVEVYEVKHKNKGMNKGIMVARVFGMQSQL